MSSQVNTRGSLSPECLWYVYQRHYFFNRLYVWYMFMWYDIYASWRYSEGHSLKLVGLGWGNSAHGLCCNAISFVTKTENVLDCGTCEHLSMTLLLRRCRPETRSIWTSYCRPALLSRLGWSWLNGHILSDQRFSHRFLKQAGWIILLLTPQINYLPYLSTFLGLESFFVFFILSHWIRKQTT